MPEENAVPAENTLPEESALGEPLRAASLGTLDRLIGGSGGVSPRQSTAGGWASRQ